MHKSPILRISTLALLIGAAAQAGAYELYSDEDSHLNANLEAMFGSFHSQENYALSGRLEQGSSSWREGYIKYGLSGDQRLAEAGTAYGAFSLLSSGSSMLPDSAMAPSAPLRLRTPTSAGVPGTLSKHLAKMVSTCLSVART